MTSTASVIGNKFALKYYTILSEKPESLWHFFKNLSQLTYGSEGDNLPDDTVVGAETISHKFESFDFKDSKVTLSVVDCHESINGSVIVMVIGWLSNKGEAPRKFVQTFLLAVQEPAGFYVHNSVFRYLKETSSPFLPNPNQAQPPHQVQSQTSEVKTEKEPEVVQQDQPPVPQVQVEPVKQEEPKPNLPPKVEEVKKEEIKKEEPKVVAPPVVEKVEEKPVETPKKLEQKEEKQAHPNRRDKKEKEKEKETQKPVPTVEEKPAPQPKGWAAIVTKTVPNSKSENQQPPVQPAAPKKAKEIKEAPKEAPKEAIKEAPKEAPKEANNHTESKADKSEKQEKERKASKNASPTSGFLPLEENLTVFVSNIPFQASEDQVRECFSKAGEVRSVVVRAKQGYCFVEFSNSDVVQKALQLAKSTQFVLEGRVLSLEEKKPNWEGGWKKEFKKDTKPKKYQGFKNNGNGNGNGKPKEHNEKDNKPKKPYLKEGIVSQ